MKNKVVICLLALLCILAFAACGAEKQPVQEKSEPEIIQQPEEIAEEQAAPKLPEEVVEEEVHYIGQMKCNQLEGSGTLSYGTGDNYKGMFHNDLRDGRGTYVFKNYSLYGK